MRGEFKHIFQTPLYWYVLLGGIAARTVFAYLDFRHRTDNFFSLSTEYWSRIGSATMGFLILLVLVHRFSMDTETGAAPIFASTQHGRINLYCYRLVSGILITVFSVMILAGTNIMISNLFGADLPAAESWLPIFLHHTMTAMVGAIGYYLFSACICDIFSNHAAAMCICGVPFGISYIINIGVIKEFDLIWFLRYGFFTELLRGRWVYSLPAFWGIWYPVMIVGVFILSIYRRKERKLL